jgi:hypothetical protein
MHCRSYRWASSAEPTLSTRGWLASRRPRSAAIIGTPGSCGDLGLREYLPGITRLWNFATDRFTRNYRCGRRSFGRSTRWSAGPGVGNGNASRRVPINLSSGWLALLEKSAFSCDGDSTCPILNAKFLKQRSHLAFDGFSAAATRSGDLLI